jgi:hypothetical protein
MSVTLHRSLVGLAVVAAAFAAGCSSSSSQPPKPPATHTSAPAAGHSTGSANAIPQHNGGDQDGDNNGGPSDGDGNK